LPADTPQPAPPAPHDRRARAFAALLFFGLIALLAAVAAVPPPQAPLRVAMGPWLGYDPLVLLHEQERLPASLRLVVLPSATDTLDSLRDGRLDAAAVTLDEALRLWRRMPDLKVIAVLSESRGADGVVLRAGLDPRQGLAGRRVLVEDSAVGGLMLAASLQAAGLGPEAVSVAQVRAVHLERRWQDGDADAVVCYEPMLSRLLAQGHTLLHSTREMQGLVYDVLVAREAVIEARAEALGELLAAWETGVHAFRTPSALPIDRLRPGTGLDEAEYRAALAGIAFFDSEQSLALLRTPGSGLANVLPELAALLTQRGELVDTPGPALLEPRPQAALRAGAADAD
jgi:NitT/TauT family transport system substrate-binding protein